MKTFSVIAALIFLSFSQLSLGAESKTQVIDWDNNSELTNAEMAKHSCSQFYCPRSADYELALEKEFWKHVQADDAEGMKSWLHRMNLYTNHFSHKNQYTEQKGRLFMLGAGGHTMIFSEYDLRPLIPVLNELKEGHFWQVKSALLRASKTFPALYHLMESLKLSAQANHHIDHLNGQTFYIGLLSFAGFALSDFLSEEVTQGILYGPTCEAMEPWMQTITGNVCLPNGAMGPSEDSWKDCVDKESCESVGTGTEGIAVVALSSGMLNEEGMLREALVMLGDDRDINTIANCDRFWCKNATPNNPNAAIPEATTIAPFKKVNMILAAAEMYGKLNEVENAKKAFAAARKEAQRIQWPFIGRIDEIEQSLFVKHPGEETSLIERWQNVDLDKDMLGRVQLPLPNYGIGCKGCHFGGVLPDHVNYNK
mgnify:CR=1 FL=1